MIKRLYNNHKETVQNFIWRAIQIFGKQGITFLIFILSAKLLIPYEFGVYNYALAIIFFLIMFGDFGISTATAKYVAEYNVTNKEKLKSILFSSGIIILGLTIIITIITLVFGKLYLQDKYTYVLYLLPMIFFAPMTSLYDGIYRGLKKFKQLAIISLIIGILSLSFVYILIKQYGLIGALISQNLFYILLLIGLALGYREFNFKLNKETMKEVGSYSFAFGIATVGYYLFSRVAILILGHYDYINEIAVYELLNKIFMLVLIPFQILGMVVAPNFTHYYTRKEHQNIFHKFKKYFFIFLITAIIFAILSYILLPPIISIFFNKYYNSIFFVMLLPVILIYASQVYCATINSGIVVATGDAGLFSYPNLIAGFINMILSLILLKYFSFMGVIYSILILHFVMIIILHSVYYLKLKRLANLR